MFARNRIGRIGFLCAVVSILMTVQLLAASAQNPAPQKNIPTITKEAMNAVVLVVASDSTGKEIRQGSGFVVSSDGKVVTNYHVIEGADSALIKLSNGAFYFIEGLLAADKERDLVVLKAAGMDFTVVSLGDSDKVEVGEEVVAIGSPLSLEATVSNGIVSAIRDSTESEGKVIQTTAPISPGSSGWALFNMRGEVIGITAFQFVRGQNLNFAIPVDYVKPLLSGSATVAPLNSPQFKGNQLTGSYTGSVHNLTAALSAGFTIRIREDSDDILGCMTVRRPLYGSGQLIGTAQGTAVQFVVSSPLFEINFRGQRHGTNLNGTYVVIRGGTRKQEGTFDLHRTSLDGPPDGFDPSTCPTD